MRFPLVTSDECENIADDDRACEVYVSHIQVGGGVGRVSIPSVNMQ